MLEKVWVFVVKAVFYMVFLLLCAAVLLLFDYFFSLIGFSLYSRTIEDEMDLTLTGMIFTFFSFMLVWQLFLTFSKPENKAVEKFYERNRKYSTWVLLGVVFLIGLGSALIDFLFHGYHFYFIHLTLVVKVIIGIITYYIYNYFRYRKK